MWPARAEWSLSRSVPQGQRSLRAWASASSEPASAGPILSSRWRATTGRPRADAQAWLEAGLEQLGSYLAGRRITFDVPLDEIALSAWDRRVLDGVRTIPFGETRGYGDVARMIGSPGSARAAGGAVGRNPLALMIPCHRVIAGDGTLGGYGGSWPADRDELLDLKAELLAHEGVHVPRARQVA